MDIAAEYYASGQPRRPGCAAGPCGASLVTYVLLALLGSVVLASAQSADYTSGPTPGDPRTIARDHLRTHRGELGLEELDLEDALERQVETRRHRTTHIYLRQRVRGLEVEGADLGLSVDRRGRTFARWSRFVSGAARKIDEIRPKLSARDALGRAAALLSLGSAAPNAVLRRTGGVAQGIVFEGGAISRDEIPAKLVYQPDEPDRNVLRLAWDLVIRTPDGRHWWSLRIDATRGTLLEQVDWISRESYNVYPLPIGSPSHGARSVVVMPPDPTASPFGWHDLDGIAGADLTITLGNNAQAQEDVGGDDGAGFRPDGGAELVFDFPIDLGQQPSTYQSAAISNVFYWNNIAHDIFYQYGFDEASGNFQSNNYGRGGAALDPVRADSQDAAGLNGAQFGTPPDGMAPRMELFLWSGTPMRDSSLDSGIIVHEYGHGVTHRLTGGPGNVSCLDAGQSEGMAEGWSDFFGLVFTSTAADTSGTSRPVGTYVLAQAPTGPGIRTQPYSTNLAVNDLTLGDMTSQPRPHGVGEVWTSALWEVYWELVDAYGFDEDLYSGSGGNNLAMQLVVDALKLQECDPTFIEARDAVFLADLNANASDNECFLWRAFAKRGFGAGASVNPNPNIFAASESFGVPAQCAEFCADGTTQAGEQCDDANRLEGDGCSSRCRDEFSHVFEGTALGGSVEMLIEGELIEVETVDGETAAQVASNVSIAIHANGTLTSLGVTATAFGETLIVGGSIDSVVISDPGLVPAVPAGPFVGPTAVVLILGFAALCLGAMREGRPGAR
jgi:extracellular elastinolytic metalloproteinase